MNKKGFTLVELTVTMAISVIIGALVFVACSAVGNYVNISEKTNDINSELSSFSQNVNEVFEKYQTSEYEISVLDNGEMLSFSNNSINDVILKFENNTFYENESAVMECKFISSISFEKKESLVKCVAVYENNLEYVIILNKRV